MTKIANYVQSIFGGSIPPTNVLSIFGALKAGYTPSNSYSSNIETLQSLAAWDEGLVSAMINIYNPALQDMNTMFHVPSSHIAYCKQAGIPEWKANITYYTGSVVSDGLGSIYRSLVDSNLNQPFTDATKWFMVDSVKQTEIGAAYTALNTDFFIRCSTGNPSPSFNVLVPNPAAHLIGRRYIFKSISNTTGDMLISTFTPSMGKFNAGQGNGLLVGSSEGDNPKQVEIICDGTYWWTLVYTPTIE